jgi:hypothetical protein
MIKKVRIVLLFLTFIMCLFMQMGCSGSSQTSLQPSWSATVWQQITGPEGEDIEVLAIDPANSQVIYVGTTGAYGCGGGYSDSGCGPDIPGGVFKTTDSGASWMAINTGITNPIINSLAIDPANSQTIYAGTGGGVFKMIQEIVYANSTEADL